MKTKSFTAIPPWLKDISILALDNVIKKIRLFPNPVKAIFSVDGLADRKIFEIYSSDGKMIKEGLYNVV
ncbi:hypothetical protein CO230_07130 [Chryseobacterium sp. 6424]|uniref:hypothetical protein n=1 Tax=Chryseobacterium sp. 6424 TaxID=2039166 RepID=UPI000EFC908F|nr:hypothetical protein [Chryseobacterium sp. 6424]AYO57915.1 hypothetical protein CO230_07130 [Chryseobacterium sp. 6424]